MADVTNYCVGCAERQATIEALRARVKVLEGALTQQVEGWQNALEIEFIPKQHRASVKALILNGQQALKGDKQS